ncbi:MAG: GTPase HflX [candidate division KSB1 bacterium]|nr:GTPase HflX [candidate division KSB1 bacterium]MDZ7340853.1 GTPase HflX [candidate division KSB1 bacterium]
MNEPFKERAILVGVVHGNQDRVLVEEYLDELALLADTAGAMVLERVVQEKQTPNAAYYIGKGKVDYLARQANELDADVIIFDDDLSPAQARNLEQACDVKIIDRSGLILDIFARRAKTREAKTQVELAQLQYLLPRLTRRWTHLSRQAGGVGIGLRGPGETQLEVDRRAIRRRIAHLTQQLEQIEKQREQRRIRRSDLFNVALLGYTNVGKSTLMNALTKSDVFVENRLFATLDATVRQLEQTNDQKILLIDTVGFVRKLPHHLVASFKSTLEETREADLLLHLVDCSHPHFRDQMTVINQVIKELQIDDRPVITVFNKIDLVADKALLRELKQEFEGCQLISAQRGLFVEELRREIVRYATAQNVTASIRVDLSAQKLLASIYQWARVLSTEYIDGYVQLQIRFPMAMKRKFEQLAREGGVLQI